MGLGKTLQEARLQRKMTASQVAAATRMKVQMIEAIEREDFSRMSAPIYGKGFIKLFADCVGVDPKPLIDEYMAQYAPKKTPSLVSEGRHAVMMNEAMSMLDGGDAAIPPMAESQVAGQQDLFTAQAGNQESALSLGAPPRVGEDKQEMERDLWKPKESSVEGSWEPDSVSAGTEPNPFENRSAILVFKYVSIAVGIIVMLVFIVSGLSRLAKKCAMKPEKPPTTLPTSEKLRVAVDPPAPYVD